MVSSRTHIKTKKPIAMIVVALVVLVAVLLSVSTANAAFSFSSDTIGVSSTQSTVTTQQVLSAEDKIDVSSGTEVVSSDVLATPTERVVNEPEADAAASASSGNSTASTSSSSGLPFDESGNWATGKTTVYDDGTVDPNALTVAVPITQKYLKGRSVEITYNGTTVVAYINDCGGFTKFAMDFTPGTCAALGITPGDNPFVSYRLL